MTNLPRFLVFHRGGETTSLVHQLEASCEVVLARDTSEAVSLLESGRFDGMVVAEPDLSTTEFLLESRGLLQQLPDGLALLDTQSQVLWHNERLPEFTGTAKELLGLRFMDAFPGSEFIGPDFGPFRSALGTGESARTVLRVGEATFLDLTVTPVHDGDDEFPTHLLVTVRDVSTETVHKQKLDAIYKAGLALGDLQPQDVMEMSVADRIELLKSKILFYTQDVLEFETVEIRLVDPRTEQLLPLLAVGMEPEAEHRVLFARDEGNGVTGFVAATCRSYLCEDTQRDPLYMVGAPGARSSLTVPLILHEKTLGTFNVESPRPGAFTQADLQFLELFGREVSIALNNLSLLEVEQASTVAESSFQLLRDVSDPLDEILNTASWLRERFLHQDPTVAEKMNQILANTRNIRDMIHLAGAKSSPQLAQVGLNTSAEHELLRSKRILIVDADKEVRQSAHDFLDRYGCIIETAHDGAESLLMARTFLYDLVIADVGLPDMSGSECLRRFREITPRIPIILLTGFGWDAGHSMVKARVMGMKSGLYKPFRRDLLLKAVSEALLDPDPTTPLLSRTALESGPWSVD
ncbi:MAG: response regulator [Planctomycetaceae bacterium]